MSYFTEMISAFECSIDGSCIMYNQELYWSACWSYASRGVPQIQALVMLSETHSDQNIELEVPPQMCTSQGFMHQQKVYLHEK